MRNLLTKLFGTRIADLDETQASIYNQIFSGMTLKEFLTLWKMGSIRSMVAGEYLTHEGDLPNELILLLDGTVGVHIHGNLIAEVSSGEFVAEMTFFTGTAASADVITQTTIRYIAWSRHDLQGLKQDNPRILAELQRQLGKNLALRLRSANLTRK